jgi:hypothetical protein
MTKGGRMCWSLGILMGMGFLLSSPALVRGDCLDLGQATSWVVQDNHTVVFYIGVRPLASLDVPDCDIQPSSNIRLLKSYTCDFDNIMIDGTSCSISAVKRTF